MRYTILVRELVELSVDVEAASKSEAREKAALASTWLDWDEVPVVLRLWVPREATAEALT